MKKVQRKKLVFINGMIQTPLNFGSDSFGAKQALLMVETDYIFLLS